MDDCSRTKAQLTCGTLRVSPARELISCDGVKLKTLWKGLGWDAAMRGGVGARQGCRHA